MGIEPTSSAWKAEVLPLNYTRLSQNPDARRDCLTLLSAHLVEGGGFEPPKAEPSDLQSDPFDRSGTPPKMQARYFLAGFGKCQQAYVIEYGYLRTVVSDNFRLHREGILLL
jgi:hypothetical protein